MRYVLPILATLAHAPADLAHAGDQTPVLEIVTFRVVDGTKTEAFLAAAQATEDLLRGYGGVKRRFLTVDDAGLWTDVIEWSSMEVAVKAAQDIVNHPDFAVFGAMIDGSTVDLRHAKVLWQME
ncbi:MAG: hypothetical protein AAF222_12785 [Pseudomonadota bacterium]